MVWNQGRALNGDVMVFDDIEIFVSFSSIGMCVLLLDVR
jgi:hypothetical protein